MNDKIVSALSRAYFAAYNALLWVFVVGSMLLSVYPPPAAISAEIVMTCAATWMDSCNALAYQMLAQVQSGSMPMPATVDDALALLEPMVWPGD